MNASASRSWFARRTVVWIVACGAASLLVATLVAASPRGTDTERGGASPYTPTKGEWLCLYLNSRQALVNSQRTMGGVAVHYLYDLSNPDTVRIKVLFGDGISEEQVHRCAARAEHHATEVAKAHGWLDWLKIERDERKVTDMFASDASIR
jgi:hypothetical protein